MDVQGRAPQPGMRPYVGPPTRPQQYANPQASRPSVDGITPPSPTNTTPPNSTPVMTSQQPMSINTDQLLPEVQEVLAQPQVLEPTHQRSSKPVILAIITLLIAGALAVTAFFAFRPETAEKVNKVNTSTETSEKNTESTTTNSQIESATADINDEVDSLNDTTDFADSELSDQTLGL